MAVSEALKQDESIVVGGESLPTAQNRKNYEITKENTAQH
jgi:hypothetical protein